MNVDDRIRAALRAEEIPPPPPGVVSPEDALAMEQQPRGSEMPTPEPEVGLFDQVKNTVTSAYDNYLKSGEKTRQGMAEGANNLLTATMQEYLGAVQGTSPVLRGIGEKPGSYNRPMVGTVVPARVAEYLPPGAENDEFVVVVEGGVVRRVNEFEDGNHVMLRDEDAPGKPLMLFQRTPDTDETAGSFGRLLGLGMAGDVTVAGGQKLAQAAMSFGRGRVGSPGTLAAGGVTDTTARTDDEVAPVFFSAVSNAVDALPMEKGGGDQMRAMIAKGEGVKAEEMSWIGLDDFLKGKKSVTKQEVRDYVEANQVRVEEVVKGGREIEADDIRSLQEAEARSTMEEYDIEFDADEGGFVTYLYGDPVYDVGGELRLARTEEEARDALYEEALQSARNMPESELLERQGSGYGNSAGPGGLTKFGDYALPGGENYREVLLRLPAKTGAETNTARYEELTNIAARRNLTDSESDEMVAIERAEFSGDSGAAGEDFVGGHFDEKNVLAHLRLNDRTGPDGEKILFIEEIQSDWHQKGRKQGYKTPERFIEPFQVIPQTEGMGNYTLYEVQDANGEFITNVGSEIVENADQAIVVAQGRIRDGKAVRDDRVPDAPLKKTWHEMSFRRVARMAAEEGYDRIAWTPGKMQAERYDLSTQVDVIEVIPEGNNQVEIMVKAKGEDSFKTLATNVPESNIADYIGKDLAEKAMRQIGDNSADYNALSREFDAFKKRIRDGEILSDADGDRMNEVDRLLDLPTEAASLKGVDLQVGGEGMKGFYDKMLKNYASKWGKKFGSKVGVTDISADGPASVLEIVDKPSGGYVVIDKVNGGQVADFKNFEEAEKFTQQQKADTQVWSMPVTKKMKDTVLRKGVPFFGVAGATAMVGQQENNNGN